MALSNFLGSDFTVAVQSACAQAREEALKAGVPVFFRDSARGIDVMEQPDGQKFEIRFLPCLPRERNYKVLRKLGRTAA